MKTHTLRTLLFTAAISALTLSSGAMADDFEESISGLESAGGKIGSSNSMTIDEALGGIFRQDPLKVGDEVCCMLEALQLSWAIVTYPDHYPDRKKAGKFSGFKLDTVKKIVRKTKGKIQEVIVVDEHHVRKKEAESAEALCKRRLSGYINPKQKSKVSQQSLMGNDFVDVKIKVVHCTTEYPNIQESTNPVQPGQWGGLNLPTGEVKSPDLPPDRYIPQTN